MKTQYGAMMGMWLAGAALAGAETFHVSTNGVDGANDGKSWAAAFRTIGYAVARAADGDDVMVSNGTYVISSPIAIDKGIIVRSVNGRDATTVDGNGAVRGFVISHAGAVLDGFTVKRGVANVVAAYHATRPLGGGAILAGGTIRNCSFIQNSAQDGGGVYFLNGGSVVSNCHFWGNTATGFGGGLGNYHHSGGMVTHSTVISNSAYVGGVYIKSGLLQNSVIASNYCIGNYAGGVRQEGGTNRNCLIYRNATASATGGGLYVSHNGLVENATVAFNSAASGGTDAINRSCGLRANNASDASVIRNTIVWGNTFIAGGQEVRLASGSQISYSCQTNYSGTGNLALNPQFYNVAANLFMLKTGSPCTNAGVNQSWMSGGSATDLEGNPRIRYDTVDMGAYEYAIPVTYYVATTGSDGENDGTSWPAAFATISNAVAHATAAGDQVVVSNGSYVLTAPIVLARPVIVRSANGRDVTIVDGNNAVRGFVVANDAILDGFTVRRGLADVVPSFHATRTLGGGAILGFGTIRNCAFLENQANDGAGVYFASPGSVISNCHIYGNAGNLSDSWGGGVANYHHAGGLVTHCTIVSNRARAGGVWINHGFLQNCLVASNYCNANYAGGIRQVGGTNRNCLIFRNEAKDATAGGLWVTGPGSLVENATVAFNKSGNYAFSDGANRGSAVRANQDSGNQTLRNLIVWGNTFRPDGREVQLDSAAQISYSCQTNWTGTGNLNADPLFRNAAVNDFALKPASPCINKGTNLVWMTTLLTTDVSGNPRIVKDRVDMGALEAPPPAGTVVVIR